MAITATSSNPQTDLVASLNTRGTADSATAVQQMSDRFLKLLVTQLKNQDPMNPMENAELTTQLAQMSTVEGINKLNDGLDALSAQFRATQVLQGTSLVGRNVLAQGDALTLTTAGAVGGVQLDTSADSVKVQVLDANDTVIQTLDLGKQPAGLARFAWDGKDSNGVAQAVGEYSFKVLATADGNNVAHTPYTLGSVMSVSLNDEGVDVEISNLGNRTMDQIRQIY